MKKFRWKIIFFINNNNDTDGLRASGSVYGLNSNKCPLQFKN